MEYLIRFSQSHETFRLAEIEALAIIETVELEILSYIKDSPFCVVRLADDDAATRLVRRSLLAQSVHSLWGRGDTVTELHADVRQRAAALWPPYARASFKLELDSFQGKRSGAQRLALIDGFADVLPLEGDIDMRDPDLSLTIFEHWTFGAQVAGATDPDRYYLGRFVAGTARGNKGKGAASTFDLKKRRYIATTSMDAELSLLTANLALAAPGKLFYDPFVGTGSFPLAAAHWGAVAWGSDIDGRAVRGLAAGVNGTGGTGGSRSGRADVRGNFEQYGLLSRFGDVFTADLTHAPLRLAHHTQTQGKRWIDGVVCDPPYGVREGPRVLGIRDPVRSPTVMETGRRMFKDPTFLPPKQPYGFLPLLDDLLRFAVAVLVDGGRLAFWMPTANDEALELPVPEHPCLARVSLCTQAFSKWSRRLITYRRLPDDEVDAAALAAYEDAAAAARAAAATEAPSSKQTRQTADDLNPFRRGYFRKFEVPAGATSPGAAPAAAAARALPAEDDQSKPPRAAQQAGDGASLANLPRQEASLPSPPPAEASDGVPRGGPIPESSALQPEPT